MPWCTERPPDAWGFGRYIADLYLDTVNPPQQYYTVTGASFTPSAALQGSELYYWYVVGNSGSVAGPASATWSFWVTGAAYPVSVTPASGGPPSTGLGTPTTFTFTFASPNGWQDIAWTESLFNYGLVGSGACEVAFWPANGQVALMADNPNSGWMWTGTLGQSQAEPANSKCSVNLAQSSMAVVSPVEVQVTLVITFLAGLPGPQQIWMQAGDNQADPAVWQQLGTWTTSAVACPGCAPSTVSGTMPAPQPGLGGTFTYRASSLNGWTYLATFDTVFDAAGAALYPAPNACFLAYSPITNTLTLMSDATGQWDSTEQQTQMGPGASPATIANSQCTVNAAGSSTQVVDANTLQLNLAVTFNAGWMGTTQTDYYYIWDRAGLGAGYTTVGTYAIATPTTTIASSPAGLQVTVDGAELHHAADVHVGGGDAAHHIGAGDGFGDGRCKGRSPGGRTAGRSRTPSPWARRAARTRRVTRCSTC